MGRGMCKAHHCPFFAERSGKMRCNRIIKAAAAFFALLTLTGCSSASVDTLLTPPKLSEEQSAVYEALMKSVGRDIRLQYPKSGD